MSFLNSCHVTSIALCADACSLASFPILSQKTCLISVWRYQLSSDVAFMIACITNTWHSAKPATPLQYLRTSSVTETTPPPKLNNRRILLKRNEARLKEVRGRLELLIERKYYEH